MYFNHNHLKSNLNLDNELLVEKLNVITHNEVKDVNFVEDITNINT